MSSAPSEPSGPSRRSVSAGALWSIPVVSAAVAAPHAAASTAPCTSMTMFTPSSVATNPVALTATSPTGTRTTIRITSILAPDTTTTTTSRDNSSNTAPGTSYNLTQGGTVIYPGGSVDFVNESATRFFEPGVLLLNQRRAGQVSTAGGELIPEVPTPGPPSQTLIFEFLDADGKVFDPVNVQLTFVDITSRVVRDEFYWAAKSWSSVGFSVAPTSISTRGGDAGVGAGTIADPFRPATKLDETARNTPRFDTFTFRSFPSGSSLVYSQFGGYQGWQSSGISGLVFDASDC
ncbi:hypothetical protein [Rathayibacter sp. VKM Ac-2760]|uniref:hypothetical protein n=1 Tax=Rathayibacter sp. VKM Ac-2760 TaxID=2609253 RepID=UPI00131852B0|nr:hypothetical protein [Rathayibacter sp. VKM Ac-2760]QHC60042.1 hypothetical protein GSU72_16900 [Rathayibacter sp. VKM Ac-2760]